MEESFAFPRIKDERRKRVSSLLHCRVQFCQPVPPTPVFFFIPYFRCSFGIRGGRITAVLHGAGYWKGIGGKEEGGGFPQRMFPLPRGDHTIIAAATASQLQVPPLS